MSAAAQQPSAAYGPPSASGGGSAPSPAPTTSVHVQPTLKVMRLYKPKLYTQSVTAGSLLPTTLTEHTALQHEFALSSMLILPDSFGEIFLGNTFSSYISVINPYSCELRDVGLTANIQCANDRVELRDNRYARTGKLPPSNPAPVLAAGSSLDMVVDYPLNQVGNHVLRVGVSYKDPISGENKSLRKFYRFGVQNPLVLSFKQSPASRTDGQVFVEAQIRNASKLPLFIDSIKFLPLLPFTAQEVGVEATDAANVEEQEPSLQKLLAAGAPQSLVNPQEELQRVFRVCYDPEADVTTLSTQGSANLGRLHVGWKTSTGEAGSVQSQPVVRKSASPTAGGEVLVTLKQIPEAVAVGQPFVAAVRVANNSSRSLALQLQFRKELMRGILCSSTSHLNLGVVEAKTATTVSVEFLPVAAGLQPLGGAVCVDVRSAQEFAAPAPLAHVLVASSLSA